MSVKEAALSHSEKIWGRLWRNGRNGLLPMQKFRAEQGEQTPELWQWIRRPVNQTHRETGRRRSKRAGGSLGSGVGEEQVGKGRGMRLQIVCASSVLL